LYAVQWLPLAFQSVKSKPKTNKGAFYQTGNLP
jgi:hypothetical protein